MNPEHYDRLNILKEIEGTFPGLPTEQVLDLARWVENGTQQETRFFKPDRGEIIPNLDVSKIANAAAREFRKAGVSGPRTWTNLDAIPSNVKAITDRDGDRAEPQTPKGQRKWFFAQAPFDGVDVSPDDGPFTEVLDHE